MDEEGTRPFNCRICGAMVEALPNDVTPILALSTDEIQEHLAAYEADAAHVCRTCALTVPPSLMKAATDTFDYALGLRSGHILRFEFCRFHGAWVHVTLSDTLDVPYQLERRGGPRLGTSYTFDRGVDVRLDEIVWCADAPQGS